MRDNDLFLTMLASPNATPEDMIISGMTPDNTTLKTRADYRDDERVRKHFTDENGSVDFLKMDAAYDMALSIYRYMSNTSFDEAMKKQLTFHRDDFSVPYEATRKGPDYQQFKMENPYEQVYGLIVPGQTEEPTKSIDELAQSHDVLLNPTTAGENLEKAQWGGAPNDHFWKYFTDTLVLAQYDEDEDTVDQNTGLLVHHKKGEPKLNSDGEFYYEKLDGRSLVGRKVLNKMNILTTDGSWANQYDFFDSDDIKQKSLAGTTMKNLALAGSMFIPHVGWWLAGFSVAFQAAGFLSALSKMLGVSDNSVATDIEGFVKSWDSSTLKSEYAQQNTWCAENFIDMVGDFLAFTRELRFIFTRVPAIFKGSFIGTTEGYNKKYKEVQKAVEQATNTKFEDYLASRDLTKQAINLDQLKNEISAMNAFRTQAEMTSFVKGYNKLGEILSRTYLIASSAASTYEEALNQGANKTDATILTLGHAAGMQAILKTGIGRWVFPELREDRYKQQAIARAIISMKRFGQEDFAAKLARRSFFKKVFNLGRNIATAEYSNGQKTLITTLGTSFGGALEMTSFDILRDLSNSCYNLSKWLSGDKNRMSAFAYNRETGEYNYGEMFSRYGMNFATGFVGGALANAVEQYKMINNVGNMTNRQAVQELVFLIRNGESDKFLRNVDRLLLADPNISVFAERNADGSWDNKQGNKRDNWDLTTKQIIHDQVNVLKSILEAEGALLDDDSLFDNNTLHDDRFAVLQAATTANNLSNEYASTVAEIIRLRGLINNAVYQAADTNKNGHVEDKEKSHFNMDDVTRDNIKRYEDQLKEQQKKLKDIIDGKYTYEYVRDALYEMTLALSRETTLPLFAEQKYGRRWEDLSESEKALAKQDLENFMKGEGRTILSELAAINEHASRLSSSVINEFFTDYTQRSAMSQYVHEQLRKVYGQFLITGLPVEQWLEYVEEQAPNVDINLILNFANKVATDIEQDSLNKFRQDNARLQEEFMTIPADLDPKERKENLDKIQKQMNDNVNNYYWTAFEIAQRHLGELKDMILKIGFANDETKDIFKNAAKTLGQLIGERSKYYEKEAEKLDDDDDRKEVLEDRQMELDMASREILGDNESSRGKISDFKEGWVREIDKLDSTPLDAILNKYTISVTGKPLKLSELIKQADSIYNNVREEPTLFQIDEKMLVDLQNAKVILKMFRQTILSASVDNADFANPYGFNKTLNELIDRLDLKKPKLAEIKKNDADYFNNEIDISLNKIEYLIKLNNLNASQKLSKNDRVETRRNIVVYKRINSLITTLANTDVKNWNGFDELFAAFNGMQLHKELSDLKKTNLNKEDQIKMMKERIGLENALYTFFSEKNADKLSDPKELAKIINAKNFNLYTKGEERLNEETNVIDDNAIIWLLSSYAAVKGGDFMANFNKILDPTQVPPIAPIPMHEQGVRLVYSKIVNGTVFNQFKQALQYAIYTDWKTKSQQERVEILKRLGLNEDFAPEKYDKVIANILPVTKYDSVLIEGIAGSGKTHAVIALTAKMLEKFHPDIHKRIVLVNAVDKEDARKLREEIKLPENTKAYGVEELMKYVTGNNYTPFVLENGAYVIPDSAHEFIEDENILWNSSSRSVAKSSDTPAVIVIDEVTRMTAFDFDTVNDFCKKNGIALIVCGDFTQLKVKGNYTFKYEEEELKSDIKLERTQFMRNTRLGISMRTGNSLMTNNQNRLEAYFSSPTENIDECTLDYFEDESGLYGCKMFNIIIPDTVKTDEQVYPEINKLLQNEKTQYKKRILSEIDKLIDKIKDVKDRNGNQVKIGYIYQEKTAITEELKKEKYKPYIDAFEGGNAQGKEGLYYIVEGGNPNDEQYKEFVNTGITRAELGVLFIQYRYGEQGIRFKHNILNKKIDEAKNDYIYSSYTEKRKEIISNAVSEEGDHKITFKPMEGFTASASIPDTDKKDDGGLTDNGELNPEEETGGDDEEQVPKYHKDGTYHAGGEMEENKLMEIIDVTNQGSNLPKATVDEDTGDIHSLLFQFPTFELGVEVDEKGFPVAIDGSDPKYPLAAKRIDSVNGLMKLDQKQNKPIRLVKGATGYEQILARLRDAMINSKDKQELANNIKTILNVFFPGAIDKEIYITYALKSTAPLLESKKNSGFLYNNRIATKYNKSHIEKNLYNGSTDERSLDVFNKTISLIIGNGEDGDILELPLSAWSSPFTLMYLSKLFDPIKNFYETLRNNGESVHGTVVKLINEFDQGGAQYDPRFSKLITLFKVFNVDQDRIVFVDDPTWSYGSNTTPYGPQQAVSRGKYQGSLGFKYDSNSKPFEEWKTLNERRQNPTVRLTSVVESNTGETTINGTKFRIAKAGHCCVFESHDIRLTSDEDIINQYIKQIADPSVRKTVKMFYVLPPKVSIREYAENIKNLITGLVTGKDIEPLGQIDTSYKILKALLESDNDRIKQLLEKKLGKIYTDGMLKEKLDSIEKAFQKDKLSGVKELTKIDGSWVNYGYGSKKTRTVRLLDMAFANIVYAIDGVDSSIKIYDDPEGSMQLVTEELARKGITGVFYDIKLPKTENAKYLPGGFLVVKQDNGYALNNKGEKVGEFRIHCKIDPPVFGTDLDFLFQRFLDPTAYQVDMKKYESGHSNLTPIGPLKNPEQSKIDTVKKIVTGLGLPFNENDPNHPINTERDAIETAVRAINGNQTDKIAFIYNGELVMSNGKEELKAFINDSNTGSPLIDLDKMKVENGQVVFPVTIGDVKYDVTYDVNSKLLSFKEVNDEIKHIDVFTQDDMYPSVLPKPLSLDSYKVGQLVTYLDKVGVIRTGHVIETNKEKQTVTIEFNSITGSLKKEYPLSILLFKESLAEQLSEHPIHLRKVNVGDKFEMLNDDGTFRTITVTKVDVDENPDNTLITYQYSDGANEVEESKFIDTFANLVEEPLAFRHYHMSVMDVVQQRWNEAGFSPNKRVKVLFDARTIEDFNNALKDVPSSDRLIKKIETFRDGLNKEDALFDYTNRLIEALKNKQKEIDSETCSTFKIMTI